MNKNKIISNKFSLMCLVALIGFMVLTTSCKKEDKVTLNGTTWKGTLNLNSSNYYTYNFSSQDNFVLSFDESTFTMIDHYSDSDGNTEINTMTGTYTYNHPNLLLKDTEGDAIDATISGNQMTMTNGDGNTFTLTKQ